MARAEEELVGLFLVMGEESSGGAVESGQARERRGVLRACARARLGRNAGSGNSPKTGGARREGLANDGTAHARGRQGRRASWALEDEGAVRLMLALLLTEDGTSEAATVTWRARQA